MAFAGATRRLRLLLAFPLLLALSLLALGCTPSSPSQNANTATESPTSDAKVATLAAQYQGQDPPGYLHALPLQEIEVGPQVGKYVPEFSLGLLDGSTITATSQVNQGRPTFLFFWATTWSVCVAELQRLKGVYPQYADKVDFYAVGVFPTHDVEVFEEFRVKRGYPWPVAVPQGDLLPDLNVTIQSTKIAFDSEGLVVHRAGMGKGSPEIWHRVFTELSTSQ